MARHEPLEFRDKLRRREGRGRCRPLRRGAPLRLRPEVLPGVFAWCEPKPSPGHRDVALDAARRRGRDLWRRRHAGDRGAAGHRRGQAHELLRQGVFVDLSQFTRSDSHTRPVLRALRLRQSKPGAPRVAQGRAVARDPTTIAASSPEARPFRSPDPRRQRRPRARPAEALVRIGISTGRTTLRGERTMPRPTPARERTTGGTTWQTRSRTPHPSPRSSAP